KPSPERIENHQGRHRPTRPGLQGPASPQVAREFFRLARIYILPRASTANLLANLLCARREKRSMRQASEHPGGFMRTIVMGLTFTLLAAAVWARQPAPKPTPQAAAPSSPKPTKTFTSAADLNALIAKAKSERKDGQPTVAEPMLELGSYDGHLEYRASVGNAAVHEKEAELFYVI